MLARSATGQHVRSAKIWGLTAEGQEFVHQGGDLVGEGQEAVCRGGDRSHHIGSRTDDVAAHRRRSPGRKDRSLTRWNCHDNREGLAVSARAA